MRSKRFLFAALSAALVCGVFFAACPNIAASPEVDVWTALADFNQLNGKWRGTFTVNEKLGDLGNAMPKDSSDGQIAGLFGSFSDVDITAAIVLTMSIDAAEKTREMATNTTATLSGNPIQTAVLIRLLSSAAAEDTSGAFVVNEAKNRVVIASPPETSEITDEEKAAMMDSLEINQNGKKIRVPATPPDPTTGTPATPEIVLAKL